MAVPWKLIAKAALKSVGGGMTGAAEGATKNKTSSADFSEAGKNIKEAMENKEETPIENKAEETATSTIEENSATEKPGTWNKVKESFKSMGEQYGNYIKSDERLKTGDIPVNHYWVEAMQPKAKAGGGGMGGMNIDTKSIGNIVSAIKSDENLKETYGDSLTDDLVEAFARIDAIDFKYKDEAQKMYEGENNVDDKEHVGIIAQELASNPVTEGTVQKDENGFLEVNSGHLTMENTAVIGELARRVLAMEKIIKEMRG